MEEEYYGKVYIKYKNGFKVSALDEYRASYDFDENTESVYFMNCYFGNVGSVWITSSDNTKINFINCGFGYINIEKGTVFISNCHGRNIECTNANRFVINGENGFDYLNIEAKNIVLNGKLSSFYRKKIHGNIEFKTDLFIAEESVLGPSSYDETIIDADSLSIVDSKIYSESLDLYYKNIYVNNSTLNAKDIALNESLHHFDKLTEIDFNKYDVKRLLAEDKLLNFLKKLQQQITEINDIDTTIEMNKIANTAWRKIKTLEEQRDELDDEIREIYDNLKKEKEQKVLSLSKRNAINLLPKQ